MWVQVRFGVWLCATAMVVPAPARAEPSAPAQAPDAVASATEPATATKGPAFPTCDHGPSSSDLSAAKGAFQAGWVSFDEGDYARAITYWEDAFRRDCTALALLLNLARAYELSGMLERAVYALETYLERLPDSPERDSIQRRIEVLREKIAETPPSEPVAEEPSPPAPTPVPEPPSPAPVESAPPPVETTERPILPLVVSGVGAAALIGGGAVYLTARHSVNDYANECDVDGSRTCPDIATRDAANRARTRVEVGSVVALAGAAATVGGLVWYFVSPPKRSAVGAQNRRDRVALEPSVAPGFAGVVVVGAY
jgi:tetratricopeptide (TPR) repeat protein